MNHRPPITTDTMPIDRLRRPVERLIHLENMSGIALIAGAVVSIVLANLSVGHSVEEFWHTHLTVAVGPIELDESLRHWVNDGLMTIFFFIAGLEIKREIAVGDLKEPRTAALPVLGAFGGMIVPALLYLALSGADGRQGWGIPMATDIAFAIGVLTLLGNRVPSKLKVFLLTLAIVDDLGAILVIALFYTASLNTTALAAAGGCVILLVALRVLGVWWMPAYVLAGCALWLATFESGIHATLAGVVCGLLAPATARRPAETTLDASSETTIGELRSIVFDARETHSVVDRLIHGLHPVTAFLIIPIFALANTGVAVSGPSVVAAATSGVGIAVFMGLLIGKPIGILGATWLAVRSGLATLPPMVSWRHIVGVGLLGGIGFTVSLFITDLAFTAADDIEAAKLATLGASVMAAVLGSIFLTTGGRPTPDSDSESEVDGSLTFAEIDMPTPQFATTSSPVSASRSMTSGAAVD